MNRQLEGAIAHSRIVSVLKKCEFMFLPQHIICIPNDSSHLYFHTLYTVTTDTGGWFPIPSNAVQYSVVKDSVFVWSTDNNNNNNTE